MKVGLGFTYFIPGENFGDTIYQVTYSIYDRAGVLIAEGITEHEEYNRPILVIELPPGDYCAYGSKYIDGNSVYFGQINFTVPTVKPPPSMQAPYPIGDVNFTVRMDIISTEDMIVTSCEDMWPELPPEEPPAAGENWLPILLLLFLMLEGGT